jgi:hypothetical protein
MNATARHRRTRSARTTAVIGAAAAVAATFVAAPAAVADDPDPIDVLPISASHRWAFGTGSALQPARDLLADPASFGSGGVIDRSVVIHSPVATTDVSAATLAGIDIVAATLVTDSWPADALSALEDFVAGGGAVLVTDERASQAAVTTHFGLTVGPGSSQQVISGQVPVTGTVTPPGDHPVVDGPFGQTSSFEQYGDVTWYTDMGPNAHALATSDAWRFPSLLPPDPALDQPAFAVIEPDAISPGSGPLVFVSDTDTFSVAYDCAGFNVDCTVGGLVNHPELFLNTFAWLSGWAPVVTPVNTAPSAVTASFTTASAGCPTAGTTSNTTLSGSWTDPDADTWTVEIDYDPGTTFVADETLAGLTSPSFSTTHLFGDAGVTHTAAVRVLDNAGGVSDVTNAGNAFAVRYSLAGIQSPFNADGSSVWKAGSTAPVKVRITDCSGAPVPGLTPHVGTQLVSSATPSSGIDEATSTSAADSGSAMRYDAGAGQYIYNLATKALSDPDAAYLVVVTQASSLGRGPTGAATDGRSSQKFALKRK